MKTWWILVFFRLVPTTCATEALKVKPEAVSPRLLRFNPTQSTVSLAKPLCVFDSVKPTNEMMVDVYVVHSLSATLTFETGKTYKETNGGTETPYKATSFGIPNCTSPPNPADLSVPQRIDKTLDEYLVRIGSNPTCVGEPEAEAFCNAPLSDGTSYRFKYLLVNGTTTIAETEWSESILTRKALSPDEIDTWIGKRSGGGIVVTVILSLLLCLLLGAAIFMGVLDVIHHVKGRGSQDVTMRSHTCYSTVNKRMSMGEVNVQT
ncbi:uroplakin-3a isoform X1 [Lepisosteus oculatus]|uniref:uroplakin-3a isoform X1 n=2 Tax=Lepisosteus oculatus TaxID=7918 RepID=UPI003724AEC8